MAPDWLTRHHAMNTHAMNNTDGSVRMGTLWLRRLSTSGRIISELTKTVKPRPIEEAGLSVKGVTHGESLS
jgi:hypothetical protein